jgi:hypothetical protein
MPAAVVAAGEVRHGTCCAQRSLGDECRQLDMHLHIAVVYLCIAYHLPCSSCMFNSPADLSWLLLLPPPLLLLQTAQLCVCRSRCILAVRCQPACTALTHGGLGGGGETGQAALQ